MILACDIGQWRRRAAWFGCRLADACPSFGVFFLVPSIRMAPVDDTGTFDLMGR